MLKQLFTRTYFDDNIPKPRHMLYVLLFLAVGYKSMTDYDWVAFGLTVFIIGIAFAVVIIIGIAWRGPIEYWKQIEQTVKVLNRITDPSVWMALGFKDIPDVITVQERKTDEHGNFTGFSFKKLPAPPAVLNQIANKVVLSNRLDFTEELYGQTIPRWRKFHKYMKDNGYIVPKNKKNVRGGYTLTKKGVDVMYQYADKAVIELSKKGEANGKESKE